MKMSILVFMVSVLLCAGIVPGSQAPSNLGSTWSMVAVGDAIITRRIMQFDNEGDPRFMELAKVIRGADAGFVNLEVNLFRLSEFRGWPEVENGGNWELGPPEAAEELKKIGFSLFSHANNHTTDYGVEGMRMTHGLLNQLGLVYAGAGENLGQASRPGYLDTPKGRIALIALATTFTPMSRAGAARAEVMGRPGLNALRVNRKYQADAATLQSLRAIARKYGTSIAEDPSASVPIFGALVEPGPESRVIESLDPRDEGLILREIRNAAKLADFVVVSSRSHEFAYERTNPPRWLIEFSKKCIDAGATAFVVHGIHLLRGIEIYKGKPVFYSLGNFIFQNETIDPMPADNYESFDLPDTALASDLYDARFKGGTTGFPSNPVWYESIVAVPTFRGTQLVDLKLYPIDLWQKEPRSQRGTPRLADVTTGRKIIERLAQQAAAFGTKITFENGIGAWHSGGVPPAQK
jgi:poly-gamma-glutamate synthesis protein (capsule biosynthesis protein)